MVPRSARFTPWTIKDCAWRKCWIRTSSCFSIPSHRFHNPLYDSPAHLCWPDLCLFRTTLPHVRSCYLRMFLARAFQACKFLQKFPRVAPKCCFLQNRLISFWILQSHCALGKGHFSNCPESPLQLLKSRDLPHFGLCGVLNREISATTHLHSGHCDHHLCT